MKTFRQAKDIKVGVIGYGGAFNMGKAHLLEMQKAGMTPTAVAEIDPERLKVATTDFAGIETYGSVSQLLKKSEVNLLAIITPHNSHARLALQCLRAGRHVVCEKPLAITTAECDAMIAAARRQKVVLSTYHNRHWDGWIMDTVKLVQAGTIGEVYRIEAHMGAWGQPRDWWRSSKRISGGILYDWGVHLLEYSFQLIDSVVTEVAGFAHRGFWADKTPWKTDTNEDEAAAVVRFKNGAWLTLTISALESNPKRGWLQVNGTKGSIVFDHSFVEVTTHEKGQTVTRRAKPSASEGWRLYQNVADHLVQRTPLVITPEWARRPIHVLDLAGQSAQQGRARPAKYG